MEDVAIIGAGQTKCGELWERSLVDLAVEAGIKAIKDAGIEAKQINAAFGGNMSSGRFTNQDHIGSLIADRAGLASLCIPAIRSEGACASGGIALHLGIMAIASGFYDMVIVIGVEKMTDVTIRTAIDILMGAAGKSEQISGINFPGLYAILANLYISRYNLTQEQLALPSVISHKNAVYNENAQFRKEKSIEEVIESPLIADPLRTLHCSPISDGAGAIILCRAEQARKYTDTPVYIKASVMATDFLELALRKDPLKLKATVTAARKALSKADLELNDIKTAYIHDCFSIAYLLVLEALGFTEWGTAGKMTEQGETEIGARITINPNGGLKAAGHPVGASGVIEAVDAVLQLKGAVNPKRQVPNTENILLQNMGGTGATAVVHILGR